MMSKGYAFLVSRFQVNSSCVIWSTHLRLLFRILHLRVVICPALIVFTRVSFPLSFPCALVALGFPSLAVELHCVLTYSKCVLRFCLRSAFLDLFNCYWTDFPCTLWVSGKETLCLLWSPVPCGFHLALQMKHKMKEMNNIIVLAEV